MSRYSRLEEHQKGYVDFVSKKSEGKENLVAWTILIVISALIGTLYLRAFYLPVEGYGAAHNLIYVAGVLLFIAQIVLLLLALVIRGVVTISFSEYIDNRQLAPELPSLINSAVKMTKWKGGNFRYFFSLLTWPAFAVGTACMGWITVSVLSTLGIIGFYLFNHWLNQKIESNVAALSKDEIDWLIANNGKKGEEVSLTLNTTETPQEEKAPINKWPPPEFSQN